MVEASKGSFLMNLLSFNAAADLTGILGLIFIIFSFSFNSALKSRKSKCLCALLVIFIGVMLSDLAITVHQGEADKVDLLYAAFSINQVLDCCMVGVFVAYLRMDLNVKPKEWRGECHAIYSALTVMVIIGAFNPLHRRMLTISRATGMIYQQSLYSLPRYFNCMILGECLHRIVLEKDARRQNRLALVFFCLSHIVTILLDYIVPGCNLVNIASLFSMLVLYTSFYAEQNSKYAQQELELQSARAALVLSQIQPHFLFNSLTTVMDLCDTDPREAKAALQELSDYLHFKITAMSNCYMVSFTEDMEFLQNYLRLEKRRYGDRLKVEFDINATGFEIPLLTLQPMVENAIRHGISKRPDGGTVRVSTRDAGSCYSITVEDDGVGFNPNKEFDSSREHIGMANVRTRLAALCGGSLTVRSTPGVGTRVEIIIRKKETKHHEYPGRR